MPGKAARIPMTERQLALLDQLSRSRTEPLFLRQRAQIIVLAFHGQRNEDIAPQVGLERHQVGLWRRRWAKAAERLVLVECTEGPAALKRALVTVLRDAPRSGSPGKFTAEQLTQIIAVACEPPEDSSRPVSHWTPRELADEVVQRRIVDSISANTIRTLLAQADLKPHRSRYWLNSKDKVRDPEGFVHHVQIVCACYQEAPRVYLACHTHTVSVDEMTGIQALERIAPTKPIQPGRAERREFEYKRHGTLTLIANFHVATGQVVTPSLGPTRTEADFLRHIAQTVATDPQASWVFVCDQLNTHASESLVRFVAQQCGIEAETLGQKGKSGVLQSLATRKRFLSDPSHRLRFVYTPKHASWLNQIEIWFSILVRRVLKRGSFASVEALRQRILEFIDYFNRTMAKPFRWTYTGRPLQAGIG
jgi:transposase